MKTFAILCASALLTLFATTTITAQGTTPADEPKDSIRDLDGYWTPIPDSPRYRDAKADRAIREVHSEAPRQTRAF